jgi:TonB family protein
MLPRKTGHVNPIYPPEAVVARLQGRSRVEGVISLNGSMTKLTVRESTSPEFARTVVEAVSLWEFDPKYLNCVPVETTLTVTVNFRKQ